jgi:hypothetical protein
MLRFEVKDYNECPKIGEKILPLNPFFSWRTQIFSAESSVFISARPPLNASTASHPFLLPLLSPEPSLTEITYCIGRLLEL